MFRKAPISILLFLLASFALADTPAPLTTNSNTHDGVGNPIGSTAGALNVAVVGGGGENASVGTNGAPIPPASTLIGGKDGSGNIQPFHITALGAIEVDSSTSTQPISAVALPLPTNACQETGGNLASMNGKFTTTAFGVKVDGSGVTQPISGAVSVSNFPGTQPVSGSVAITNFPGSQPVTAAALPLPANAAKETGGALASIDGKITTTVNGVKVDGSAVVQPISVSALPLPTNASKETGGNLASVATSSSAINGKITTTVNGIKVDGSATTQPVSGSVSVSNFPVTQPVSGTVNVGNFPATQVVSAASLPLPANAAKETGGALASIDGKITTTLNGVKVDGSGVTQPVSGTVNSNLRDGSGSPIGSSAGSLNVAITSGGGTNPSVAPTGAPVPASATFLGGKNGSGDLEGLLSTSGSLNVNITGGGASNASVGVNNAAGPGSSTQIGARDGSGNLKALLVNGSGYLRTDSSGTTQPISGTVTAAQGAAAGIGGAWPVKPTDGTNSQGYTASSEAKVSVTQPLPTGTNAIGSVTVSNFPGTQPVSGTVTANAGTGTFQTNVTNASLTVVQPTGTSLHTVVDSGTVSQGTLPVFAFFDVNPVLDTSVTNIPASSGSAIVVVASLSGNVKRIRVSDTTGQYIGVYENATLRYVISPGMDDMVDVSMSSGSAVKLKAMFNTAISIGDVAIQFM